MKQAFKYLGIGIFLTAFIFTINNHYFELSTNEKEIIKPYQEKIEELQSKINDLQQSIDKANEKLNKAQTENQQPAENKENNNEDSNGAEVKTGTIYVYENISLYDIGKQAEDLGIVKNGRELELYLSKPEYARTVQIGQFDLSSDMTLEQMAKILTGQKVE